MPMTMSMTELYWFVGLFEGEGSVGSPAPGQIRLSINSTDKDVLEKVVSVVGGRLYGPYTKSNENQKSEYKPQWVWALQGKHAAALAMTIYPILGVRRKQKTAESLLSWRNTILSTDIVHGTEAGYSKELKRGLYRCADCRKAHVIACRPKKDGR